jgi:hypothetical protein
VAGVDLWGLSAADMVALPGALMRDGSYVEPARLRLAGDAAAVNRARGHGVED